MRARAARRLRGRHCSSGSLYTVEVLLRGSGPRRVYLVTGIHGDERPAIENAERLGLAQLHQLRGRIGRGSSDSWCLLRGKSVSADRFKTLERTDDGFEIAEEDLRRRGMGDLAGLRQAGMNTEGLEDLAEHTDLLFAARDLCSRDPGVARAHLEEREGEGHLATP